MIANKTPVVMICYSRAATLKKSLGHLAQCEGVEGRAIRLYLDAPYRDEDRVKCEEAYGAACEMRDTILPNLEVIRRSSNFGVPGNLMSAVGENLDRYGRIIFFEDDVCVSRTFLQYLDEGLEFYKDDKRIFCINGYRKSFLPAPCHYPHDVDLTLRNEAWGFGIWKDRWEKIDFEMKDWYADKADGGFMSRLDARGLEVKDLVEAQISGRIHTWDVQCTYHMAKYGLYAVEPRHSLTKNIGFGAEGVHCKKSTVDARKHKYYDFRPKLVHGLEPCGEIVEKLRFCCYRRNLLDRVVRKVKSLLLWLQPDCEEPLPVDDKGGGGCDIILI